VTAEEVKPGAMQVLEQLRRSVPGNLARDGRWWNRALRDDEEDRKGATPRRHLLHTEPDGTVSGYASYRVKGSWTDTGEPDGTVLVDDVRALSTPAYARLWQFLLSLDLVRNMRYPLGSPDDPLRHLVGDPRALHLRRADDLWLRLVDVDRALAARTYAHDVDVVVGVEDALCPWNARRWRLAGGPDGATCAPTTDAADLTLDVRELGAAYLGGTSLVSLTAAGLVREDRAGAVAALSSALRSALEPATPFMF